MKTQDQADGADSAYDMLCWMLEEAPRVEPEDAIVKVRVEGERYFTIPSPDLYALLQARQYLLARRERRDG